MSPRSPLPAADRAKSEIIAANTHHGAPADPPRSTRREFVHGAALATASLMIPASAYATMPARRVSRSDELNLAIIGPGSQGRFLITRCLKIPGVRFKAVCDIWPYHQRYAANILKKYDQPVNVYEDYRELLAQETDLDAVIVATPDWVHHEHTIAALRAGLHVYCEKEMSNTVERAAEMVRVARETKRHLQIGHQRRSNPRYWHALRMIEKDRILGRVTTASGQWHRPQLLELGWPKKEVLPAEKLQAYGYETMDQFRNWRWYKQYSGGLIADLGSHQIDVFNWFLKAPPKAVLASAGIDFYKEQSGRDWYDNILAIYEYDTPHGMVRANYSVQNTTSHGGFFETFMGKEGSLIISEDPSKGHVFRERHAKRREWEDEASRVEMMDQQAIELKIGETLTPSGEKDPEGQRLLAESQKPPHQLHLENFFDTIRGTAKLTCPPEVGYEVCVSVLKANQAVAHGRRVTFDPAEFKV